jgi:hypothetical protein
VQRKRGRDKIGGRQKGSVKNEVGPRWEAGERMLQKTRGRKENK